MLMASGFARRVLALRHQLMSDFEISLQTLAHDPLWLPHRYVRRTGHVELVKIPRSRFSADEFLADHTPDQADNLVRLPLDQFTTAEVQSGNAHFIFHTAFCRSTLLARALNIPGISVGMSEPGIIANLMANQDSANGAIHAVTRWLARPQSMSQATFIKPTNHANAIIPSLMAAQPDAKAILISNSLISFLKSVNRRGLLGRQWARKLYLEVQQYAPLDLGMSAVEHFAISDMQAAGLAWLLQRRWFLMVMEQLGEERFVTLDSDDFDQNRKATLKAALELAHVHIDDGVANDAANAPLFNSHSKLGGDFAGMESRQSEQERSAIWDQEAGQVQQWIDAIARQAGIPEVLPRPLC